MLTFGPHANGKTFFQSTFLAFSPHVHVDFAVVAILALVHCVFGNAPPEETFASFTRKGVIMVTRRPIAAHQAQFFGRSIVQHATGSCGSRSSTTGTRGIYAAADHGSVVEFFLLQSVGVTADAGQTVRRRQLFFNWKKKRKQNIYYYYCYLLSLSSFGGR